MSDIVDRVTTKVEADIRSEFERIWSQVTAEDAPEHRVIIWGSTVDSRDRDPVDLDLIFEYYEPPIDRDKQESIESWLKDSVEVSDFAYIDPLVTHHTEIPNIISRSRNSRVYCIDDREWIEYDT